MAITRTTINGDINALKTALESLGSGFFDSVTISSSMITCKDDDNNPVFYASICYMTEYRGYRTASNYISAQSNETYFKPMYFYKVGDVGGAIELAEGSLILIAKTKSGKTGIVLPEPQTRGVLKAACFGDDSSFTGTLKFADSSSPTAGNHTQFVNVPLFGTYDSADYFENAFYIPMAQTGMRDVVQTVVTSTETYLTDGYFALKETVSE